jgi:hypothetical protein
MDVDAISHLAAPSQVLELDHEIVSSLIRRHAVVVHYTPAEPEWMGVNPSLTFRDGQWW